MPAIGKKKKRKTAANQENVVSKDELPLLSSHVALQRCTSIGWRPHAVAAIEACPDGSVVAVARDNGSIEFWDTSSWCCTTVIPGKEEAAINDLTWTFDASTGSWRLFSCGLDGLLVEWDLRHLRTSHVATSIGGASWALAAAPHAHSASHSKPYRSAAIEQSTDVTTSCDQCNARPPSDDVYVAVAADDGSVRLMVAEGGSRSGLVYKCQLGRADSRALSVAWDSSGTIVYAGFADGCIRAYGVASGHEVIRITAAVNPGGTPDCIWALSVLPDGCVASASSRGTVQVWDPQFGTLLSRSQHHSADVSCLAALPSGTDIFAAGVDPGIVKLTRSDVRENPDAVAGANTSVPTAAANLYGFRYSDRRRPHSHDVRGMAMVNVRRPEGEVAYLVTGGNDAQVIVHVAEAFGRQHPVRVCPAPCAPVISTGGGRLLAAADCTLDVWRTALVAMPVAAGREGEREGERCTSTSPPAHLASIKLPGREHLAAAALSPCGQFFSASTASETFLFGLRSANTGPTAHSTNEDANALEKVRIARLALPEATPAAITMAFAARESAGASFALFLGTSDGRIVRLRPSDGAGGVSVEAAYSLRGSAVDAELREELQSASPCCTGAAAVAPAVSHLTVSPCGRFLAATAASSQVHLLSIDPEGSPRLGAIGQLPLSAGASMAVPWQQDGAPQDTCAVTAVSFTPSGGHIAVATSENKLQIFTTDAMLPEASLLQNEGLQRKLATLAGHVCSFSFRPGGAGGGGDGGELGGVVVASRTAICHVSLDTVKDGCEVTGWGIEKRARKRIKPAFVGDGVGGVARIVQCQGVVLSAGWIRPGEMLLVEVGAADMARKLPAPLMIRTYGR